MNSSPGGSRERCHGHEKNTFAKSSVNERKFLRIWLEKNANSNLNHLKIFASTNGTDHLMANVLSLEASINNEVDVKLLNREGSIPCS